MAKKMKAKKTKTKKKKQEAPIDVQSDIEIVEAPHMISAVEIKLDEVTQKLCEAIDCLKLYTKKDQIGDLANPALELLTKWAVL